MNSQQAQQRAKLKRDLAKTRQRHDIMFASQRLDWARYGVFNTRHEMEGSANQIRLTKKLQIFPLGDHWCFWNHNGRDLISHNTETIRSDSRGVTDLIYANDSVSFTRHCLQQLYVRGGMSVETHYKRHLGLDYKSIQSYYDSVYNHSFDEDVMGSLAFRSDIVVPFRGGALLGNVRFSEIVRVTRRGDTYYMLPDDRKHKTIRAETWISNNLLRPDQREVCEALLGGDASRAAEIMKAMPAFQYEQYDDEQMDKVLNECVANLPTLNKLI